MRRALVTGASGLLGWQVYHALEREGVETTGWIASGECSPKGKHFSPLGDYIPAPRELDDYDLIVHTAALTDAERLESLPRGGPDWERARFINAKWPESLAACARNVGARFIHISTEAVYDGEKPGLRREEDPPNPINFYAKTKWEAETRVLFAYPEATVVRTTFFGWSLPGRRKKLAEEILGRLRRREPVEVPDQTFSPLYAGTLADLLLELARRDCPGILNLGSAVPIDKPEFAQTLAEAFGESILWRKVSPAEMKPKRARNTGLDVTYATRFLGPMPSAREEIERMRREEP